MANLTLTYAFGWVLVCLLVAVAYAWLQYTKDTPWSATLNYSLAALRIILVFITAFLLLEPYITSTKNHFQKPIFVLAVDNSASIALPHRTDTVALRTAIKRLNKQLVNQGFDVRVLDVYGHPVYEIDSIKFTAPSTNLANQLTAIKSQFNSNTLAGALLISDGIYTSGYTPLAVSMGFPLYTLAVGDSSQVKDVAIKNVRHNATVFEGNELMVEVQLMSTGLNKVPATLEIFHKNSLLWHQQVELSDNKSLQKWIASIPVKGKGKQSFTVKVKTVPNEFTLLNNKQQFFVDVIDARKQILILASSPHPDIKAIKSVLDKNEYYEVKVAYELPKNVEADLLIAHQYPGKHTAGWEKEQFTQLKIPAWLLVGTGSDVDFLTRQNLLTSTATTNQTDWVKPILNASFNEFSFSDEFKTWVSDLPPVAVPYGVTLAQHPQKTLLQQQIGNVVTNKPLLFFGANPQVKQTVFLGTGLWKWKLDEYRTQQSFTHFESLVQKVVQFTMSNKQKKRLFVHPQQPIFYQGEPAIFTIEEYNALFERISGKEIEMTVTNENGKATHHRFTPLSNSSTFKLTNLTEGVYYFKAMFTPDSIAKQSYTSAGQFVVKSLNKEALNPVADYTLLAKLAEKFSGKYYTLNQLPALESTIKSLSPVSIIHSSSREQPLYRFYSIITMLIFLAATEWFLRKYFGGY